MKTYISLLLLFLIPMALSAQFRMVSNGTPSWTTVNDSTYSATITFAADQTGNSYVANAIQQNYRIFTGTEQLYRIDTVSNATFSSADLTIVRTSGSGAPSGQIMVFNPGGRQTIPQVPFGSTGSTALIQAAVDTWNARASEGLAFPNFKDSTAYISTSIGNDATGEIGKLEKPFASFDSLLNANFIEVKDGDITLDSIIEVKHLKVDEGAVITTNQPPPANNNFGNAGITFRNGGQFSGNLKSTQNKAFQIEGFGATKIRGNVFSENTGAPLQTILWNGSGLMNIELDTLVSKGQNQAIINYLDIADTSITNNINGTKFDVKVGYFDVSQETNEGIAIWDYWYCCNNTDTIYNAQTLVEIDEYVYRPDSAYGWSFSAFHMGGFSSRNIVKNHTTNFRLKKARPFDPDYTAPVTSFATIGTGDTQMRVMSGNTESILPRYKMHNSIVNIKVDDWVDPKAPGIIYFISPYVDASTVNITLGNIEVKTCAAWLTGIDIKNNSSVRVHADRAITNNNSATFVIQNNLNINTGSELVISGTWENKSPLAPPFQFNNVIIDSTSKMVFRNLKIVSNNQYAITAINPVTIHVEGFFEYTGEIHPNVTIIYNNSAGDGNGLITALPQAPVNIDAAANNLTIENLPLFRVNNLDTAATVTHELFNSSNSVIPHRWSRYQAGDTVKVEMQYGEMMLKDTSGEHSLADLAKQHYISLTNGFQTKALTGISSKILLGTTTGLYGSAEQLTDSTLQLGPGQWKVEYNLRASIDSDSTETYQAAIFVDGSIQVPSVFLQRFNDNLPKEQRPIQNATGFIMLTVPSGQTREISLQHSITQGGTAQLDRANLIATRLTP